MMQRLPISVFPSLKINRNLLPKPLQIRNLTYYEVLGVKTDATPTEIKAAYVKCSKKLHPDVNKHDPKASKKFAEVNEAYSVLSKSNSKLFYDESLSGSKELVYGDSRSRVDSRQWTLDDVHYYDYYHKTGNKRRLFIRKDFFLFIAPLGTLGLVMIVIIQYLDDRRKNGDKNLVAKIKADHQRAFARIMLEREKNKKQNS